jgi:3-oxoacyl-[acyl-carrier protein] reductase
MDALESVKAKIEAAGGAASVIKCDVTDPKQVAAVFEHATSTYGGVDFVCAFRRQ